jgi:hypothetical protein
VLSSILVGKAYPVLSSILFGTTYPMLSPILVGTTYPVLSSILFGKIYPVLSSILLRFSLKSILFGKRPILCCLRFSLGRPILYCLRFSLERPILCCLRFSLGCSDVNRVFIDGPLSLSINVRIGPPDYLRQLNGEKLKR